MVEQANLEQSEVKVELNLNPTLSNEEFARHQVARNDLRTMKKKFELGDAEDNR